MKSVLHIGNIAGVPQSLSKAQRKVGLTSDVLAFGPNRFKHSVDYYYPNKMPIPFNYIERMFAMLKIANKYDVLHFHYNSIIPFGLDFPFWKVLKEKVIIHHHGSDIRHKGEKPLYAKFADRIFVSTPDLLEWSPNAVWIPNPIDIESFPYIGVRNKPSEVNIVHAPSSRAKKGTKYIVEAIDELKREGYRINFLLVENTPHERAIEIYKEADIAIDQLLLGGYCGGVFTLECMSLGKPVCTFVEEKYKSYMPFLPVFNTSVDNITENLRKLIEDRSLQKELSLKGRKYVEQVHDVRKVVKKVIESY